MHTCPRCRVELHRGKAIAQTLVAGVPDFPGQTDLRGQTFSPGGPGKLIDVMKCPSCGHSTTKGETMPTERLTMRIAFREEGDFVNAYFAPADSLDGAILLGSMRVSLLNKSVAIWDGFRSLAQKAMGAQIKGVTGSDPDWNEPVAAPAHERSGNA